MEGNCSIESDGRLKPVPDLQSFRLKTEVGDPSALGLNAAMLSAKAATLPPFANDLRADPGLSWGPKCSETPVPSMKGDTMQRGLGLPHPLRGDSPGSSV